jgi:cytochrome P450
MVGNGLLTSEGEFWLRQRRVLQPAFHRERLVGYAQTMVDRAEAKASTWHDGEERAMHPELMRLTLDIVSRCLFGADLGDDAVAIGTAIGRSVHAVYQRLNSFWLFVPERMPTPQTPQIRRSAASLDRIVYRIIDERRADGQDRGDVLSMLLAARDERGAGMPRRQVRDEVMTLFLAGHETTAIALTWTLFLLAQQPAAEARLHAELASVLGDRPPSFADVPHLTEAQRIVNESMRLYPPAWIVEREALEDVEIAGVSVRRGTTVMISQWVTQRDPRWFPDPDSFEPDRWLNGQAATLPRYAYFPFGGGPRMCIGYSFATTEAILLLATLAQRFRFELVSGQAIRPDPVVTLRPSGGVRMRLQARRPAQSLAAEGAVTIR